MFTLPLPTRLLRSGQYFYLHLKVQLGVLHNFIFKMCKSSEMKFFNSQAYLTQFTHDK